MDSDSNRCVALMAIKPHFAFRLLTGQKRVEFRRRPTAKRLTHIVVYATQPVSAVVGVLEIAERTTASPASLWRQFARVGGIPRADFFEYFSGSSVGVAYSVHHAWSYGEALELGRAGLPRVAPQAYQYLSFETMRRLEGARNDAVEIEPDYRTWLAHFSTRGRASDVEATQASRRVVRELRSSTEASATIRTAQQAAAARRVGALRAPRG